MPPRLGVSKTIRLLGQHGVKAFDPSVKNGYYQSALVKPRAAAHLRKRAVIDGSYGSFDPKKGGWNPEWDTQKKMFFLRPFKTHKRDRTRQARADKITKALETTVPQKIEKYRQEVQDRRPIKDIAYQFKRAVMLAKGRESRRKSLSSGKIRKVAERKKTRQKYANMDSDFSQMDQLPFMKDTTSQPDLP